MGNPSETSTESNFCKNAEIKQVGEFTQNISLKSNNNFLSTIKLDNEEVITVFIPLYQFSDWSL